MNTHTIGPWEVIGNQIYESNRLGRLPNRIIAELVTSDWEYADPCPTSREQHANAKLIAAAPELLAALRDILAAYHGLTLGAQDTSFEGKFKVAARAAIAKADRDYMPK